MNIIFTDYTKEEFKKLKKHKYVSSVLSFLFGFLSIFFIIKFGTSGNMSYMTLSMFGLLLCALASINFLRFNNAKYNYIESLNKNGKENIKSQEYDQESSQLIIIYNKEDEEIKNYINLRNMIFKFDDTMTDPIIDFDTNEIIKPRIIIASPGSGKKRLSGGEKSD